MEENRQGIKRSLSCSSSNSNNTTSSSLSSEPKPPSNNLSQIEKLFEVLKKQRLMSAAAIKAKKNINKQEIVESTIFKMGSLIDSGNFNYSQLLNDFLLLSRPSVHLCDDCAGGKSGQNPACGKRNRCYHQGYFDAMQDIASGNILPDFGSPNSDQLVQKRKQNLLNMKTKDNVSLTNANPLNDTTKSTSKSPQVFQQVKIKEEEMNQTVHK